ncbi:MAG TPA: cache domain-containing protein [Smithellaceae bacterium]|nr:cache domain-containing protein [Smithellaceae bacterium]HQM46516.1 cache domain-containing protein [Smithellaceae bacterium]
MLGNLKLSLKIAISIAVSTVTVCVLLVVTYVNSMSGLIADAERHALEAHMKSFRNQIATSGQHAETMSALVGGMPLVQEKFAQADRKALADQFLPVFPVLSGSYGVVQFQFLLPPATSFFRVHMPGKFGDDLSRMRHTVVATNATGKPTRGIETGVAGLGVRGMVPVSHQGRHIGTVEFGMNLGQAFLDDFKARYGVDSIMHVAEGNGFKIFASTLGKEPILSPEHLQKALAGEAQLENRMIQGASFAVYAASIKDYSGKPIGVVELAMNDSDYRASLSAARRNGILLGLLALGIGLAIAFLTARQMVSRINKVVEGVHRIAQGDLSAPIVAEGNDEVGKLALVACEMRKNLHALASDVRSHAAAVHHAAREIAQSVESQAATSMETSSSVAEITSTMEEFSASSTQIADYSQSVVDIANQTLEGSHKGSEAMQTVLLRMEDIRMDNQQSLQEIIDLGAKSKHISKVMEIINAVADQSRLIAFNAALEASSAGEAGRRFSVVAAEIRRLADSVTDSTREIEVKINEIQDSINRLVITSEKRAGGIIAGTEASAATARNLNEMVLAAGQTSTSAQQISLSTQQQKTASNQVLVALREIVTASSHNAQSIARISQISKEMSGLSEELSLVVNRFKLEG